MKSFLELPLKFSFYCPRCALDAAQALDQSDCGKFIS